MLFAILVFGHSMASASVTTPPPRHIWIQDATSSSVTVRWTRAASASKYQVRLNSQAITTTSSRAVRIINLNPSTFGQVQIVSITKRGQKGKPSIPVPVVTRASATCTHFVSSTNGSDQGTGTAAFPWKTITKLVSSWTAGDVGCVSGTFVEDVSIKRGGSRSQRVTLRSLPGTRASLRGRLWVARGADYVTISSLLLDGRALDDTARNSLPSPTVNARATMLLDNDISNKNTRVCVVLGSIRGYGIALTPTLAYNRIHDCGQRGFNTHHGIYIESTRFARVTWNAIFDNADRGIQLYPDAQNSLIFGNIIDGNGTGIIFSGAEGLTSNNNRVFANVISNSMLRSNIEHYWENPRRVGFGNIAANNCLGGATQGNIATPVSGYRLRGNVIGRILFNRRALKDLRPTRKSDCRAWLMSRMIPLTPTL